MLPDDRNISIFLLCADRKIETSLFSTTASREDGLKNMSDRCRRERPRVSSQDMTQHEAFASCIKYRPLLLLFNTSDFEREPRSSVHETQELLIEAVNPLTHGEQQ